MSKPIDENDRLRSGTIDPNPAAGTKPMALRAVRPDEVRAPSDPCNLSAEQALLAALLWAGTNAPETVRVRHVIDILLTGEPFFVRRNGDIYDAIRACEAAKAEHDPIAVHAELVRAGNDHGVTTADLIAMLDFASTISEQQARVYAEAVRDTWMRRQLIAEARRLVLDAQDMKRKASDVALAAKDAISLAATQVTGSGGYVSIGDATIQFFRDMADSKNPGMATGIRDFDEKTGGLFPFEVSIVAARTSVGKSVLSAQIADGLIDHVEGAAVLYASLEMKAKTFSGRLVAARAGINAKKIRRHGLSPSEWSDYGRAANDIQNRPLYFVDVMQQTIMGIAAIARALSVKLAQDGRRLALIVVDHIGLVKPSESVKKETRERQIAENSRGLRWLTDQFGCHVMGLMHINREPEKAGAASAIPQLHHIRESETIANDADMVSILHRARDERGIFDFSKPTALIIAKARNDEQDSLLLNFDAQHVRFTDWNGSETFFDFYGAKRRPMPGPGPQRPR